MLKILIWSNHGYGADGTDTSLMRKAKYDAHIAVLSFLCSMREQLSPH